ncbi:hypothetical protein [Clostridium aceticum]|uniref:hypothetical protein n=1 Tax=Clostridium aceticum TaxID=84022 RepID=UPI0011875D3C|nr:hypothetical protein [Clostridium aceticum]
MKNTKKQRSKENHSMQKNKNLEVLYNKGKSNYIIRHGILSWGISTGIIFILLTGVFQYGFSLKQVVGNLFSSNGLFILSIFALGGFVWGSIMWKWLTKEIEKNKAKKKK